MLIFVLQFFFKFLGLVVFFSLSGFSTYTVIPSINMVRILLFFPFQIWMIPVPFSCHFGLVTWLRTNNAESRSPYLVPIPGKHWLSLLFMILVMISQEQPLFR